MNRFAASAFKQISEIMEDIVMENEEISQKTITFGDCKVVIQLPDGANASDSVINNIVCFKSGKVFWKKSSYWNAMQGKII